MQKKLLLTLSFLLVVISIFTSCPNPEPDPPTSVTLADGDRLEGGDYIDVTIPTNATVTIAGDIIVFGSLSVGAGATVKAESDATIFILPGAKIEAFGTGVNPITFTSAKADGSRRAGDWGGIQILGNANIPGDTSTAEATTETYGGLADDESSGNLRYTRIQFAGRAISSETELNSLGLFGVGRGTTIAWVQLHAGKDDGIEMFGGAVNLSWIVATGNGDDQVDSAAGWRGRANNIIAITTDTLGDKGFEIDGDKGSSDSSTLNTIAAFTNVYVVAQNDGLRLRRNAKLTFSNLYVISGGTAEANTGNPLEIDSDAASRTTVTVRGGLYIGPNVNKVADNATLDANNFNRLSSIPSGHQVPTSLSAIANHPYITNSNEGVLRWTAYPNN